MAKNKGKVCVVLGTRPEIIKMFPVIQALEKARVPYALVHTNQHYSENMDAVFFRELGIRAPDVNLQACVERPGRMIALMIEKLERLFLRMRPAVVLAEGDTNSVVATSLAAVKCGIPFGHVEAGLRSFDRTMPEEINRIVADHVSAFLFVPTSISKRNVNKEGITRGVHVVGNTIVDALKAGVIIARKKSTLLRRLKLKPRTYGVLTLHRQSNADSATRVREILKGVSRGAESAGQHEVIFPVHPRTRRTIIRSRIPIPPRIRMIDPIGFIDMLSLLSRARMVCTDSGGVQEEACILKVPCVTLRDTTERPETLAVGGNVLAGTRSPAIVAAIARMAAKKVHWRNPFGDGTTGMRIVQILKRALLDAEYSVAQPARSTRRASV